MDDWFVEFDDRIVIHMSTTADVVLPDVVAKYVPGFAATYNPTADYNALSATEQLRIKAILANPGPYYSAQAPLSAALAGGDVEALTSAMLSGLGPVKVTSNLTVYKPGKHPLDPKVESERPGEYHEIPPRDPPLDPAQIESDLAPPPNTATHGLADQRRVVVLGWDKSFAPENEERWDFLVGFVRVTYGMMLRATLRFPYESNLGMGPTSIDGPGVVQVALAHSLIPMDASAADYVSAGQPGWSGDEASLVARVWLGAKVHVLGVDWIHIVNPDEDDRSVGGDLAFDLVNEGASFTSLLGEDNLSKTFSFPAEETGLQYGLSIFSAGLDLRLKAVVEGDHVAYDMRSVGMSDITGRTDWSLRHSSRDARVFDLLQYPEAEGSFGVVLDDFSSRYDLELTLGLRGVLEVELSDVCGCLNDWAWSSPWLEPATLRVASVELPLLGPAEIEFLPGERLP